MPGSTPTTTAQQTLAEQEKLFSNATAAGTGLDPRVVYSQVIAEGAYAPGGTGGLNFLNLRSSTVSSLGLPYAGSSPAGFAQFANLTQAEQASIAEYKSPAIHLGTPAPTPQGQITQIAATPWDASHYGGVARVADHLEPVRVAARHRHRQPHHRHQQGGDDSRSWTVRSREHRRRDQVAGGPEEPGPGPSGSWGARGG